MSVRAFTALPQTPKIKGLLWFSRIVELAGAGLVDCVAGHNCTSGIKDLPDGTDFT